MPLHVRVRLCCHASACIGLHYDVQIRLFIITREPEQPEHSHIAGYIWASVQATRARSSLATGRGCEELASTYARDQTLTDSLFSGGNSLHILLGT